MATSAKLLEDSLLVIWNDRNSDNRMEAMQRIYSPDIHFFESNTGEAIVGHKAINELITKLQSEWPVEFRFELNRPSQVNHTIQIVSWNLGTKEAAPVATGTDIAITEKDQIKSLYLFLQS